MTRELDFDGNGTEFGKWVREQKALDSRHYHLSLQNLDYIAHRYNVQRRGEMIQAVMLLEEKRYMGKSSFAQRDTHSILDQALRHAAGQLVTNARGVTTPFHYFGYHRLQFENTSPADGKMFWNGVLIDVDELYSLLRFEDARLSFAQAKP